MVPESSSPEFVEVTRPVRSLDAVVDLSVVGLAVWTVCFQLGLWVGATAFQAVTLTFLAGAGILVWLWRGHPGMQSTPEEAVRVRRPGPTIVAALLAVAAAGLLIAGRSTLFWVAAVAALGGAAWANRGEAPAMGDRPRSRVALVVLVALAAGLVSATQIDWSLDNTYYVDRAFAIRDAPGALPIGTDSMFSGDGRYVSLLPENDLGALEGLVGVASRYLGGHPLSWYSFFIHPWFAFIGALATWRAARALGSRHPQAVAAFGVGALYFFSMEGGIATRAFSARTGRTGFVAMLVPVLIAYTLELMARPGARSAVRLAAAGIASGGLILSALPVVPTLVIGAAAAGWRRGRSRVEYGWIVAAGAIIAVYFLSITLAAISMGRPLLQSEEIAKSHRWVGEIWAHAIGESAGHLYIPLTLILLLAWAIMPNRAMRRFVIAAPLSALLIGFGPTTLWVLRQTAAATALWRLGWSIPLGLLMGLVAAALWEWRPALLGKVALVGMIAVLVVAVYPLPMPRLARPAWDGNPGAESAATLVSLVADGSLVGAPLAVAGFIPVVTNSVYPVQVYSGSIDRIAASNPGGFNPSARRRVTSWLERGTQGREPHLLIGALDRLAVAAVCVAERAQSDDMRRTLVAAGFELAGADAQCQFWVRSP